MTPQNCNCAAIRQAARQITQYYDGFLAPSGLRASQFSVLARLKRMGPMTINALAAELAMDRTTLGRNMLPLERDGLISIEQSASDGRSKELHLTKAGSERLRPALRLWTKAQASFEERFGGNRAAQLRDLMGAVVAIGAGAAPDGEAG